MKFATDLRVQRRDDGKWVTASKITYYNLPEGVGTVTIPEGFVTDFASVPRLPFMFWLLGDRADYAALIHDYLYATAKFPRAKCDAIFRHVAGWEGVGWLARWTMWTGIRVGGWASYGNGHPSSES